MALNENNKPIFASVPKAGSGGATDATATGSWNDDTNGVTIYTAPSLNGGAVITSIVATTDEAANRDILVYILDGAEVVNLGAVSVPLGSGESSGVAPYDVLANIKGTRTDQSGNTVLDLPEDAVLKYVLPVALTGGDFMEVAATAVIENS